MKNFERDWEDFDFLTPLLNNKVSYIEDSSIFFDAINRNFPIGFNRIDWGRIPHQSIHIKSRYPDCKGDIEKYVTLFLESASIDMGTDVFVCFDGYTEGALSMPLSVFVEYSSEIFVLPQHTYVIPKNAEWCLNYTMEQYLNFGASVK